FPRGPQDAPHLRVTGWWFSCIESGDIHVGWIAWDVRVRHRPSSLTTTSDEMQNFPSRAANPMLPCFLLSVTRFFSTPSAQISGNQCQKWFCFAVANGQVPGF